MIDWLIIRVLGRDVDLLVVGGVFAFLTFILICIELLHRSKRVRGEYGRKLIHISFGLVLASLALVATRMEIAMVCGLLFVGSVTLQRFKTVEAPFDVTRFTIGGHVYPLSIGLTAAIFEDIRVYIIAVLHLALADGAAAVIGKLLGRRYYYFFGVNKTYMGSSAFLLVSFMIYISFLVVLGALSPSMIGLVALGALFLTVIEGMIGIGLDNAAVPIVAAVFTEFVLLNVS